MARAWPPSVISARDRMSRRSASSLGYCSAAAAQVTFRRGVPQRLWWRSGRRAGRGVRVRGRSYLPCGGCHPLQLPVEAAVLDGLGQAIGDRLLFCCVFSGAAAGAEGVFQAERGGRPLCPRGRSIRAAADHAPPHRRQLLARLRRVHPRHPTCRTLQPRPRHPRRRRRQAADPRQ
jgi:hypothetical protein